MQVDNSLAAAPWQLSGQGYVIAVWQPSSVNHKKQTLWRSRGQIQLLIFANYTHSDVGPYYELLHIPNLKRGAIKGYPSINKIYVSSMASVINGQQNWGIPKELAVFDYHSAKQGNDSDVVVLKTTHQQPIAHIEFQPRGLKFPISTALIPKRLRTLVQDWQGKRFYTAPEAKGQAYLATVKNWSFDPVYFPDLSQAKVISAIKIKDLEMVFPTAKVVSIS